MTTVPRGEEDVLDTVERASQTPEQQQPWAELGLTGEEYDGIAQVLGRRPTRCELAMYSVMWSEHCSYKSSRTHLRRFAATTHGAAGERLLAGVGANAGVVAVSDDLAVTFKVESHNHPSFVEPASGAATGVGGIIRDVLAMGARPVAVMDSLRVGPVDAPDTARVLPGVVAGVGGYGNCMGLPNVGGEVVFDECYAGNPLVNALCLGVVHRDGLQEAAATTPGDAVVLLGARTGRDGIGGVSVLASASFDGTAASRRPSVQVGDPFTEKVVTAACLELFDADLVRGVSDLGGAGLTCALSETAAAGGTGMQVDLDAVPLRDAGAAAHEVLVSESQERMLALVDPDHLDEVVAVCARWGVPATRIGTVTAERRLRVSWRGETVADVPPVSLADDGPVYSRPAAVPADAERLRDDAAEMLPRPSSPAELRETLLALVASPNLCSRRWVVEQYDRLVGGATVLAWPDDAGVVRLDEETGLGVALSLDGEQRFARLDPYAGAQLALAEAYRNVATSGAVPLAVTDCLNVGSPEDPGVMHAFAELVRGLADGCVALGLPVTGGNVSFYNQTMHTPVDPTPVVGVLGVFAAEDGGVGRRTPTGFEGDGDVVLLLGSTAEELSGSQWALVAHRHLGGRPPRVDLERERLLAEVLVAGSRDGMLSSAHDLSGGGLAQAVVESCLVSGFGVRLVLPSGGDDVDVFVQLFSESAGRVLVTVPRSEELRFRDMCEARRLPCTRLGVVDGWGDDAALEVQDVLSVGLPELRAAWEGTLPRVLDGRAGRGATVAAAPPAV